MHNWGYKHAIRGERLRGEDWFQAQIGNAGANWEATENWISEFLLMVA